MAACRPAAPDVAHDAVADRLAPRNPMRVKAHPPGAARDDAVARSSPARHFSRNDAGRLLTLAPADVAGSARGGAAARAPLACLLPQMNQSYWFIRCSRST